MVADIIKITLFPVSMSLGAFRETHHSRALSKNYIKILKLMNNRNILYTHTDISLRRRIRFRTLFVRRQFQCELFL